MASFRKLVGATNPLQAEPGTLRGDFGRVTGRNIVHASDSPDNGEREAGARRCLITDCLKCSGRQLRCRPEYGDIWELGLTLWRAETEFLVSRTSEYGCACKTPQIHSLASPLMCRKDFRHYSGNNRKERTGHQIVVLVRKVYCTTQETWRQCKSYQFVCNASVPHFLRLCGSVGVLILRRVSQVVRNLWATDFLDHTKSRSTIN